MNEHPDSSYDGGDGAAGGDRHRQLVRASHLYDEGHCPFYWKYRILHERVNTEL